jgi:predicted naringenin-chalcone synthase
MYFIGLGTAAPAQRYTQAESWRALEAAPQFERLTPRSRTLLRKILHANNGIATRHLVLDPLSEVFELRPDVLTQRFARHAPALATEAAGKALTDAGLLPADVDGLIICTCTGYLCPGLTSYVVERLGLPVNLRALDLVGHGCGAALPSLQTAAALLSSAQCQRALVIAVEVCSAAFYLDDDPGVLVSACLFGDGAAAAVLANQPRPGTRTVQWLAGASHLSPSDRDRLRFEHRDGMLRNILTIETPLLAGRHATQVLPATLQAAGLSRADVTGWIVHPGGRNVLNSLRDQLGLRDADLVHSAGILREYGNLSSPSVLFVLQAALAGGAPGGHWWLASFGAGFSFHGAMLKVE